MLTFLPLGDIAVVFVLVIALLVGIETFLARRREKRILSQTSTSVLQAQTHSDAQIAETRRRTDAYQTRIFTLMEEHNALLREILDHLRAGGENS